ncbi:unnamed protein product [Lymnaea stagnalis]|uniref:DUF4503 domain-containing protein n=1 Tax=Lymnaea stagnalis TaxID=6523 RepID=A0AAV2IDT2_LYMST
MPQYGWEFCGEGFAGVQKFRNLITGVKENGNCSQDKEMESLIRTDGTPDKTRHLKRRKVSVKAQKQNFTSAAVKQSNFPERGHKQEEFLSEFKDVLATDQISQPEDIHWSSSSSEELEPEVDLSTVKNGKHSSVQPKKRRLTQKKGPLHRTIKEQTDITEPGLQSQKSIVKEMAAWQNKSYNVELAAQPLADKQIDPCRNLKTTSRTVKQNQDPDVRWSESSFQVVNNVVECHSPNLHNKVKATKKPKVVRKLKIAEDEESLDQISDVESLGDDRRDDIVEENDLSDVENTESGLQQPELLQNEIISGTSSSSESTQGVKIKASDWVLALQKQKTPVKNEMSDNQQEGDSAKKRRKFTKGSMTDRLSRLISREKSSIRFWHHSVKEGTFDDTKGNSSTMQLLSMKKQFSVYISRCHIIAGMDAGSVCRTIFSIDTVDKLLLKAGVFVEIFPPWQQLDESGAEKTFLCTNFVRIVKSSTKIVHTVKLPGEAKSSVTVLAKWKCPCSHDQSQLDKVCPAVKFPVSPNIFNQTPETALPHPSVKLLSIGGLTWPSFVIIQERLTLLESMEINRIDGACLPTFVATVLRVFRHRVLKSRKIRHQLLLEDSSGTIIFTTLPDDHVNTVTVTQLEGKSCCCSGLALSSRTNRDKQPSLFSAVDVAWTQRFPQSGSDASDCLLRPLKTPNFAYVLESATGLNCEFVIEKVAEKVEMPAIDVISLEQLPQINSGSRITFLSRFVVNSRLNEQSGSQTAYVFDGSCDQAGYTALHRLEVGADCVLESQVSVALFKDVLVKKDCLYCDSFTLVLSQQSWQDWDVATRISRALLDRVKSCLIRLPLVNPSSQPGDLVSAQGVISSVDDSTAYSWEECEECGSDKLATSEEAGFIYCTICQRQVTSPKMKMRMEVYIGRTMLPPNVLLKIDLSQRTIESILPSEADEEGYDVEQVINRDVTCQVCLVQSQTSDDSKGSTLLHLVEMDC